MNGRKEREMGNGKRGEERKVVENKSITETEGKEGKEQGEGGRNGE